MQSNQNQINQLPNFQVIDVNKIESELTQLLNNNRRRIEQLLESSTELSWDNFITQLEILDDQLHRFWSPISHLHSVMDNPQLRDAYQKCIPLLSEYETEIGQNEILFHAYQRLKAGPNHDKFNQTQRKIIEDELRDFRLSGIDLPPDKKKRYAEIQQQLALLASQFDANLLDATDKWDLLITDSDELKGLPSHTIALAKKAAAQKNQQGWLLTLDFPCYDAVLTFSEHRPLREKMYFAYTTRASDQGPQAGQWDNGKIIDQILSLRHEEAQILGYKNFVELSLVTKMAHEPHQVMKFLQDLIARVKPVAELEMNQLKEFAHNYAGQTDLAAWDIAYFSEKLQEQRFQISRELLRPYFPAQQVLRGMFDLVERLYGIKIVEQKAENTWHPDVRFYQINDSADHAKGYFYVDLFARPNKRSGAWMADYCSRFRFTDGHLQLPVAYLTCNFTPAEQNKAALLTHEEVLTLFHEFGHGLHHLLTEIDYLSAAGMNGFEWDAVELPSQFMEHWCWQRPVIDMIASHFETGELLPEDLWQKLIATRNFHAGLFLIRQLEFALFDLRLHLEYDPKQSNQAQAILNEVREQVAVIKPPPFNRFQHSFGHIFAGGYGAGYYSYLWADVLASDSFAKFEEEGLFNQAIGRQFLKAILAQGSSRHAIELFKEFRGREPDISALLRHNGLLSNIG